ncbi:MAG: acetate--CoA ligase family protein, partial [Candidatus Bipolaricaulia bacterium]
TPEFGSLRNPIDLTGMATPREYRLALRAALGEERIHSIILLYSMGAEQDPREFAEAIIDEYDRGKPLVVAMLGGEEAAAAVRGLNRAGIPAYEEPEEAVGALAALYRWRRYRERPARPREPKLEVDWAAIGEVIDRARGEGRLQLLEPEAKKILRLLGLAVPEYRVAHSLKEALQAAEEFGYPVVLKIISAEIIHKTEAGGIRLNLRSREEVEAAYKTMVSAVGRSHPRARLRGVLVTRFIAGGTEVIVGASRDPSFGPTVMFGLGGIYVEVLKDITFRVAPLTRREAREMIGRIRSAALLRGVRGEPKKDIKALAEALYRVGAFAAKMEEISELDINPLRVMPEGKGCLVLDARMTISEVRR